MRFIIFCLLLISNWGYSQHFDQFFIDKTLRVDAVFAGNSERQSIVIDELNELPSWAGRKQHLSKNHLGGNGVISMYDIKTDQLIYTQSFSTLYQEWLSTPEAQLKSKNFENVFLLPFPKSEVRLEIALIDSSGNYPVLLKQRVDPTDVLIHKKGYRYITPHTLLHRAKTATNSINIVIVAEGFQDNQMDKFKQYAQTTIDEIFAHQPFGQFQDRFNIYAVESVSSDNGVSVPRLNEWKNTAVESNFDTFYSERYLTTARVKKLHDLLAGIPYEHIIILANTDVYGGGGIYNAYTLTTTGHANFKPIVVHEFGHSFAGLSDEYFYESDVLSDMQSIALEPWEQNITTLKNFDSKWKDMLSPKTPIPTTSKDVDKYPLGVYEGLAGKKIYKAALDCRMKTNTAKEFCPVCQRAISRLIQFYTD
ncbi:M64 family metallopeptidase [Flavobacterium sp. NKUCC04_CG]|uniref:M64 family metallopeptidase n=1 Tax=Flavobacterium sp. NKUCC04_CG TaxID=2842121 RepID=UPI001C5BB04C|nr:M64 family metallopeptidase [Flavobacterium sp. NKUCC04_CG]MBW3519272.1 IgA Peptidase M64 [Flavobacterium sp. NKUCC04_CG]